MDAKKGKKSIEKWTHEENLKFLDVWRVMEERLRSCANKTDVYLSFQEKLKEEGVDRTILQIKKKLSNFKEGYKKAKPGPTGSSPSNWPYFEKMAEILGSSHYYNQELASTLETEIPFDGQVMENVTKVLDSSTQLIKGSKKRKVEEMAKERDEELKETIEDFKNYGKGVIDKFADSSERIEKKIEVIGESVKQLVQLFINNKDK